MTLRPGVWVTGDLQLVRRIGTGGMGSVWAARHARLGRNVAVKFMAPELAAIPASHTRFKREAESAMRLRSPHVVQVVEYAATADGLPYIVMELLSGEDLHQRLARCGPLTMQETLEVVTQAARALMEAHSLGIVHRDVKPENMFLTPRSDGVLVKVLDFGVAADVEMPSLRLTNTGVTLGTPFYMSPEQFLSAKTVDPRCDLWSLAVVAYLCLTGRAPFGGETFGAVCVAVERGRVTPPSALRAGVPLAVDAWFARAFSRSIRDRFQSAEEMASALAAASTERTAQASAEPLGEIDPCGATTLPLATSIMHAAALSAPVAKSPSRRTWAAPLFAVAVMLAVSTLRPTAPSAARWRSGGVRAALAVAPEAPRVESSNTAVEPTADAGISSTGSRRSESPCCP